MKNIKKIAVIVLLVMAVTSLQSCKAGCGCPKFSIQK